MSNKGGRRHELYEYYKKLPNNNERLMTSITGGVDNYFIREGKNYRNIGEIYNLYSKWLTLPNVLTVQYRKLIGPEGGGSREDQLKELDRIIKHLGTYRRKKELEDISRKIFFRKSGKFRKGIIGYWQNHFTDKHKEVFKERAGKV